MLSVVTRDVDENMLRTPAHYPLLHLLVLFVTDVHWNHSIKHHQSMMHYVPYFISKAALRCA